MARMSFPRVSVTIEAGGDDVAIDVQTDNRDAVRYDIMRSRKGWPAMTDAPLLAQTVMAWSAILRTDQTLVPADVEKALDVIVSIQPIDEDGNPVEFSQVEVDPTNAGL